MPEAYLHRYFPGGKLKFKMHNDPKPLCTYNAEEVDQNKWQWQKKGKGVVDKGRKYLVRRL